MAEINLQTPKDEDSEVAILGCVLLNSNLFSIVADEMTYDDFFNDKHKTIFSAMLSLYQAQKNIEFLTVISELEHGNLLERAGGVEYITEISGYSYNTANLEDYIDIVRGNALKRKAIDTLNTLIKGGYNPQLDANDYISSAEKAIFELSKSKRTKEFQTVISAIDTVKENVEKNALATGDITGLDTGFNNLNRITLGLQKSNLIILAARPAMGKSAMAMNIAVNVASKNKNRQATVAVFNLEMSADQLAERMIASEALVNFSDIRRGKLDSRQNIAFSNACEKLSRLNLYFDDSGSTTVEDIRTKCRKLSASPQGLDLVVIDYLQLINSGKDAAGKQRNEQVSEISRALKQMARELDIPVLALAQLSRKLEDREDKRPIMADLRDSGAIEQDADIVMFIYRDGYYKQKNVNPEDISPVSELIVAKNRSGQTGTLYFNFKGQYAKFEETIGDEK